MLITFAIVVKEIWKSLNPVPIAFQPKSVGKVFCWELQPNQPNCFWLKWLVPIEHDLKPWYEVLDVRSKDLAKPNLPGISVEAISDHFAVFFVNAQDWENLIINRCNTKWNELFKMHHPAQGLGSPSRVAPYARSWINSKNTCLACCFSKEGLEAISIPLSFYQKSCVHIHLNNKTEINSLTLDYNYHMTKKTITKPIQSTL